MSEATSQLPGAAAATESVNVATTDQPTRAGASFGWGAAFGVVFTVVALLLLDTPIRSTSTYGNNLAQWLNLNLGYSAWLFATVLGFYSFHIHRLRQLLSGTTRFKAAVELDQLTDVWINLFVGIGVIWTAVGMRNALQAALGDPADALADSAGSVLENLVDGGILLALTTTIVGGVGSYLMRLAKTMIVGARLQEFYEHCRRADAIALAEDVRAIRAQLNTLTASSTAQVNH